MLAAVILLHKVLHKRVYFFKMLIYLGYLDHLNVANPCRSVRLRLAPPLFKATESVMWQLDI